MSTNEKTQDVLFQYEGMPKMSQAFPLAIQHVVAMIVGCVTPALIVSSAAGLKSGSPEQILLVQSSLVFAAISTIIMLFPIPITKNYHIGARLPMIMGVSFAYVSTMQSIARGPEGTGLGVRGLAIIFGATKGITILLVIGIIATVLGFYGSPILWIKYGEQFSYIAVLDCISRIVTIMFTSNQILIGDAFNNKYAAIGTDNED